MSFYGSCEFLCPRVFELLPPYPKGFPRPMSVYYPACFQITVSTWGHRALRFCVSPLRIQSVFFIAPGSPESKPHWSLEPNVLEVQPSQCRTHRIGNLMWILDPSVLGENLCNCNNAHLCVT